MQEEILFQGTEKEIVNYCNEKNVLVAPDALKAISTQHDYKKFIDELLSENVFVLTEKLVRERLLRKESGIIERPEVIIKNAAFRPIASDLAPNSRIIEGLDPQSLRGSAGKVENFLAMFRDKFEVLSAMLIARSSLEIKPISRLSRTTKNHEITLCGIVFKKWVSKNGHPVIQLEDMEKTCLALFLKTDQAMFDLSKKIMPDDVIAIKGKKISDDMIIASEVHWPDLPVGTPRTGERDLNILATSDIHIGSKLFLETEFNRFLAWLNGGADTEKEKMEAGKIKYMVVCGDNVDGIGVYPDQFDELAIKDIYQQYEAFSELIKQVPQYIEVFIIPGQHDAVRRADPQPAIRKEFVKELYGYKNIHFLGSPSWIEIEGLKAMLYHGASLHDIYASVPGFIYHKPEEPMTWLLKRRDTMATYGLNQPYVPEKKDYMVMRDEPDFYFGGDMHRNAYAQYRACSVINSGTWQGRTGFQVQKGFIPTPATPVTVNLLTRKITEKKFGSGAPA